MRLQFENRYGCRLAATPTHIYLAPHPVLRPFVAHYTLCLAAPILQSVRAESLTLIPDASGCFVFSLQSNRLDGRMYGPTTEIVTVPNDLGFWPFRFFVEFRPGGLHAFTGIPQWELSDQVCLLSDTAPDFMDLTTLCFEVSPDLDEFVHTLDTALARRSFFLSSSRQLLSDIPLRSPQPVQALSKASGYSPRHISRLFREEIGMGVKSYLRVLRVNQAVRRIEAGPVSLTHLAQDLDYYDQAHFIHDFKSICGLSPSRYQERLSDFYKEPFKLSDMITP